MKLKKRLFVTMLSIMMVISIVVQPFSLVSASTSDLAPIIEGLQNTSEQTPQALIITSASLNKDDETQMIIQGSETAVNLPKVNVTFVDSTTESIDVTWTADKPFDSSTVGTYIYTANLIDEKFVLDTDVTLPIITVEVTAQENADSGLATVLFGDVSGITAPSILDSGDGAALPSLMSSGGGVPVPTSGDGATTGTETTLTSVTFKNYVPGDPTTLWDYTTATTFVYNVAFTVDSTETENRVFTFDINPNNITNFPYMISGVPEIEGVGTDPVFSDYNTELTYTVTVSDLTKNLSVGETTAYASFDIGITLNGSNSKTIYKNSLGTFAAAIGNTLLNQPDAKFGATLVDSKNAGVEIIQRHVPKLYDVDGSGNLTPWSSVGIIGDTAVSGFDFDADENRTISFNHIGTDKDATNEDYSLWIASNGKLYFSDGKDFIGASNSNGKITTTINSTTNHLPISGITYTTYNTLNTLVIGSSSTSDGNSLPSTGLFGYKNTYLSAPFSEGFDVNEHHYFEGSLATSLDRSVSVNISSINAIIPSNTNLDVLSNSGIKYLTVPHGVQSTITYRQLTIDDKGTPQDASDDVFGVSDVKTTVIPNIIVNIADYERIDELTSAPGSDGNIVDADTTNLVFRLENEFPKTSSDPNDPFTKTYAGHTLTIEIPETFDVGQFKITGSDNNEERDFTHFKYYKNGVPSAKLEANWKNGVLQLPAEIGSLTGIDKLELYISDMGLTNGQYENEGGNVTKNYTAYMSFTGCTLDKPNVEENINGRFETTMEVYISAPGTGDTFNKLVNTVDDKTLDDLDITWHFELPGDPDQDNLTLTLNNTHSGDFVLDNSGDESTVFNAYITQALENGKAVFNVDSRVFKDVKINITTDQDNHIQLLRKIRLYESYNNTWVFIPKNTITDPDVKNNVIIYYTTNKYPQERAFPVVYGELNDFTIEDDTEYLTSIRIEVDEMQLPESSSQIKNANFIEFVYADSSTISNGDLPISTSDLTDKFTIEMTASNFVFEKKVEAYETFSYKTDTAHLLSVEGHGVNSVTADGQEHRTLGGDTVVHYHIQDSQTSIVSNEAETIKEINSNFPAGSAIYLQLNPAYFEYIGSETSKLTRVIGTSNTKWLRYDISGEDGVGSVTIPADTILVKEEIPAASVVSLFTHAYLDTSALLGVDAYKNGFVDYTYTSGGIEDTFGITSESDINYGVTSPTNDLINIFDSVGASPPSLTVRPLTSTVRIMSANSQIADAGHLEFGTKQDDKSVIRYYAHESDDLELRLVLSTDSVVQKNVEVKVVVPNNSSIMKIGLRGDVYTSLSTELKALVGNDTKNITYYSDEAATIAVIPNSDFSNVKSVKILIPTLAANTSTAIPIQLKALEADVYSKPDNAQVDVIASTTMTNNTLLTASYIFDWYEISGIAYFEKTSGTPNGIYDGDDEYLDELTVNTFSGLNAVAQGTKILSYNNLTGKYTILVQPKSDAYNLVYTPTNSAFRVSTNLPTTPIELNNNYNGINGVKFNANILNGLSPLAGDASLKQLELDNGNVDLALVKTVYTVTFKEDKDATTNVDQYKNVIENSTVPKTDNTFDIPDDKVLVGWTTDENPTDSSELWNFNDDGETDTSNDTKVTGNIVLYPVIIDKENTVTVTFDAGNVDTIKPTPENNDFVISGDDTASKQIKKGDSIAVSPTTTPNTTDNKEFEFWYIDENGNGKYDEGETKYDKGVTYDKNTIYVAQYKETGGTTGGGGTEGGGTGGGGTTEDPVIPSSSSSSSVAATSSSSTGSTGSTSSQPGDSSSSTSSQSGGSSSSSTAQPQQPNSSSTNGTQPPQEPVDEGNTIIVSPDDATMDENGVITVSPEVFKELPDGEYVIEVEFDRIKYTTTAIVQNGTPLSMGEFKRLGAWSLFDLLSTIFVTLTVFYVAFIKKRKNKKDKDEEDEAIWNEYIEKYEEVEDEKFAKLRKGKTISLAIEAVMAIILLFTTQDFTQPMIIFDIYSIAFALSVILSIVIVKLVNKRKDENEDEELEPKERYNIEEELERDVKKLRRGKIIALLIDVVLILALIFITRDFANLFVIDGFTIIFILCTILLITIPLISNYIILQDEDENGNEEL